MFIFTFTCPVYKSKDKNSWEENNLENFGGISVHEKIKGENVGEIYGKVKKGEKVGENYGNTTI